MKSRALNLLGIPEYHPEGFSRVGRQMRLFDAGGADTQYSDGWGLPAPPPPRVDPNFPVNHDWTKGPLTVGNVVYTPNWYQPSGEGDTNSGGLTGITASLRGSTDPGVKYLRYSPSGEVIGEGTYGRGSRGFFGDFFSGLKDLVTDSPILQMASIIPSPIQPFAAAANAAINKDPLSGIAALAGAGGFTDVANAARVASAVNKGDILGAVTPGLNLAGISDIGGISTKDITKATKAAQAIKSGNPLSLVGLANSLGFDWSKGSQNIGGTIYAPQMAPAYLTDEAGNIVYTETGVPALLMEGPDSESAQYVMRPKGYVKYNEADRRPGGSYEVYDLSGKLLGREPFAKEAFGSSSFFGDLFETATGLAKAYAPLATMAIGAGPLGGMIGSAAASGLGLTGLTAAQTAALGSAIGSGGITALSGGDIGDVLKSAAMAGAPQFIPKDINTAINAARAIESGNPLALARIASSYLPEPTMPGAGISEDTEEDFFGFGKPGFMPTEYLDDAEVQRELTSLLGRYPTPAAPSEWFLGENIMSGVPEWDISGVNAGLPIGNLEQDFSVAQTKEGPRIVDSAGNVGTFVNGEFVVDTGVTPDLSYLRSAVSPAPRPSAKPTPAPAPAPAVTAAKKQDDLGLLMALAGMMTPQQQAKDDYQLAQIGVQSPYGIYGA